MMMLIMAIMMLGRPDRRPRHAGFFRSGVSIVVSAVVIVIVLGPKKTRFLAWKRGWFRHHVLSYVGKPPPVQIIIAMLMMPLIDVPSLELTSIVQRKTRNASHAIFDMRFIWSLKNPECQFRVGNEKRNENDCERKKTQENLLVRMAKPTSLFTSCQEQPMCQFRVSELSCTAPHHWNEAAD